MSLSNPKNISLPFFTYGLFKPGEFAHDFLVAYVDEAATEGNVKIAGTLYEKDGVAVYVSDESVDGVVGQLIHFTKPEEGYQAVNEINPSVFYEWGEVSLSDGRTANILVCRPDLRKEDGGVEEAKLLFSAEWQGGNDPFFDSGMKFLKEDFFNKLAVGEYIADETHSQNIFSELFLFKMAYSLLWQVVDRYTTLRYGLGLTDQEKREALSHNEILLDTLHQLKGHFWTKDGNQVDDYTGSGKASYVFCIDDFLEADFAPDAAKYANNILDYYFQIAHMPLYRSRNSVRDLTLLQNSFAELFALMDNVIALETHRERRGEDTIQQMLDIT